MMHLDADHYSLLLFMNHTALYRIKEIFAPSSQSHCCYDCIYLHF